MERKLESVHTEVKGLRTALAGSFDEMKDILVTIESKIDENARKARNRSSGDKDNIIVAGGLGSNSVEMFNWRQRTWSPLQPMPKERDGATSFTYNNQVTIAGGTCAGSNIVDDMIAMTTYPIPDLLTRWSDFPAKLPDKLEDHSSVVYKDRLIVTGGGNRNVTSDSIKEVQLTPPYSTKILARMPERRQCHGTEIFNDNLLIVGGRATDRYADNLSSVLLYEVEKNELKHLAPLPYEVSRMATAKWGDNIVVIGGADKEGKKLDAVILYNVKTGKSHMLPSMKYKRKGCAAVVVENNIVVLGGWGEEGHDINSVEGFNFERYCWEELPGMSRPRWLHTAAVV